jgi:tellurite resistance protein TerC
MYLSASVFAGQFDIPAIWWVATFAWFGLLLFGDLYLSRKQHKIVSFKQAVIRSVIWIALGLGLGAVIWAQFGHEAGSKYYAGFFVEKALSFHNIFIWGLILSFLSIPKKYHLKVLLWGILGAIVFRTIFVVGGLVLIDYFQPALLLLGLVLLATSYRLLISQKKQRFNPEDSKIISIVERFLPLSNKTYDSKLFVRINGKLVATSLFFAICIVELTDIVFAIDSVPASLAIVRDPYIVLASNIAALLGLRALYFVFEYLEDKFYLMNKGLALILSAIAVTLILEPDNVFGLQWFGLDVSPLLTVSFVGIVLTISIILSFLKPKPLMDIGGRQ